MAMYQEGRGPLPPGKAHPLAGCLPIVIQNPGVLPLYKVLFVTIEMRMRRFSLYPRIFRPPPVFSPLRQCGSG